jgi:hypothetical protein
MSTFNHLRQALHDFAEEGKSSSLLEYAKRTTHQLKEKVIPSSLAEHHQYADDHPHFGFKVLVSGVSPTIE